MDSLEQNQTKIKEVLELFEQTRGSTQKALREMNTPTNLIELWTSHYPDFNKLYPQEIIEIFTKLREAFIVHLHAKGFSRREISQRMGGSSAPVINKVLKKHEEAQRIKR